MITAMVVAIALSDCAPVKPGFEFLLGLACAAQIGGGSARLPTVPPSSIPTPSPPGNPDGGGSGAPGKSGGHSHGGHGHHGKGE